MVGVGPDEEKIKDMVRKLGLQNSVEIRKAAYGKEKFEILSKAQFVSFPSRHEGFSLFSLEALASGLPLVAFDIPSLSWTSEDVALKAKKFDINSYSKALIKASDKALSKKMGISSRKIAKKYTWENVANSFEKFFIGII